MGPFSWIEQEESLSSEVLTARVQEINPDDVDETLQDIFFPRRDVDSVVLAEMGDIDWRPVSNRREWNTRGRQINTKTPDFANLEFIPVESFFSINEREIQKYGEAVRGNAAVFRDLIRMRIPQRLDDLAQANIRRLEVDYVKAWTSGTIVATHPHKNQTQTMSYGFDTTRYQTAGTAWDNVGVDAYAEFIAWAEDGTDAIGSLGGVVLRRSLYRVIQADAPMGLNGVPLTRGQFEDQVSNDLGVDFKFYIRETQYDIFTDGGMNAVRTDVWPDQVAALLPADVRIGNMCYAPIFRAEDLADVNTNVTAPSDNNGQRVFREVFDAGRGVTHEVQVNAFPVPNERRVWVIDAGA